MSKRLAQALHKRGFTIYQYKVLSQGNTVTYPLEWLETNRLTLENCSAGFTPERCISCDSAILRLGTHPIATRTYVHRRRVRNRSELSGSVAKA